MKLKTKLIPLASVAAVCATVAPISLTSCGNNGFVNLKEEHKPSFDKLSREDVEGGILTTTDANILYSEWIKDNPNNFIEEYYWSTSSAIKSIDSGNVPVGALNINVPTMHFTTDKEKITDLSIKTKQIHILTPELIDPKETTIFLASFTLEFKRDYTYETSREEETRITNEYQTGTIKFVNVPFWISLLPDIGSIGWTVEPIDFWILKPIVRYWHSPKVMYKVTDEQPSWSMDIDIKSEITRTIKTSAGSESTKYLKENFIPLSEGSVEEMEENVEQLQLVGDVLREQLYGGFYLSYYLYDITYGGM